MHSPVEQSLPLSCGEYSNRGLFADHFLSDPQRLRAMEEWKQPTASLEEVRDKIVRLFRRHASRFNSHTNEAQTEKDFIRPVLDVLWGEGCYQVQVNIPNVEGRRQPDYAFFRTAEERREADTRKGTLEYWRDAPALGDAKAWETSLDRQSSTGENPSAQICNYLYRSRVRWGILTNGRQWRLYERDKSSAGGIYYEINLVNLLDRGNGVFFKYFWLFFRREAFVPDPMSGLSFVEKVFKGSADYATEVGKRLKVYDALRHLMNGFLAHPANGLSSSDPGAVQEVHDNSLVLLYRLLFILYAEDRGILPCDNKEYAVYSLRTLHKEINANLLRSRSYPTKPAALWGRLCNLFSLIDCGFEEDGRVIVPAYNGGLFSPEKHPHIAYAAHPNVRQWQIGDRYLGEAVDLLAYERKQWDKPTSDHVDYVTLDVQHLGSIYEGLLELQPHIATTPLLEVSEKGKSTFRPESEVPNPRPIRGKRGQPPQPPRRIKPDEVYLVTNRGERKATGSYYTPKYIVDYIVENTVGPAAQEAAKKVAELRAEVDKEIKRLERPRREREKSSARDAAAEIAKLDKEIEDQKRRLLEPYLSLKILDPAMGSGHFLVGAADHLSLNMATDPNLIPPAETDSENVQAFYKRLIVERCLYGVDLNPLAVELAKLSLWLHTVSRGKALSFLDHHLRCGNSLVGARIEDDLMKEPPQFDERGRRIKGDVKQLVLGLYEALHERHLVALLELLHKITDVPTHDAATEKLKEGYYAALELGRERYRAVANCWLAPFFGVAVGPEQYQEAVAALRGTDVQWGALTQQAWFQAAQTTAQEKHFFHWELEFPEVFFDKTGKPKDHRGFDVVIGNPAYVSFGLRGVGKIADQEKTFFLASFPNSAEYKISLYAVFMEAGLGLTTISGRHGYIVPDSFLLGKYFSRIREYLISESLIDSIVLFREDFWQSGTVGQPVVYVTRNGTEADSAERHSVNVGIATTLEDFARKAMLADTIPQEFFAASPLRRLRLIIGEQTRRVIDHIERHSLPLESLVKFYSGLIGKKGQSTITVSQLPSGYSSYAYGRLIASSGSLGRFSATYEGFYCPKEASLYKSGYTPEIYENPKLFLNQTGDYLKCCYDGDGYYCLNNMHVGYPTTQLYSLLYANALICSRLLDFYYKAVSLEEGRANAQTDIDVVDSLPIPRIAFTTPKAERARLLKEGKQLYEQMLETMIGRGAR